MSDHQVTAPTALTLSVIIPAYNERKTLPAVLQRVAAALPGITKEIIVVDDGSSDGTREWLAENFSAPAGTTIGALASVRVLYHDRNGGKGKAVRTGLAAASNTVIVIQDADLEYDPADWPQMFQLFERDIADVVYGSRFYGRPHRVLYFYHLLGNKLITWLYNLLFNQTLSDLETCYKMFRRELITGVTFTRDDFGIEVELAAWFSLAPRCRMYEMGIAYYGRTYEEGKKINWRDGLKALWYVVRFRLAPPRRRSQPT
jgi:glycosyltransferase involved in cell wall biosynthesis